MRLEGEVAVVTGGGSGIGEATCQLFAREGAKVVVVDWIEENAEAIAAGIREEGGQAAAYRADIGNEEEALSVAPFTVERFGKATILVNNAGIRVYGPITEATEESWDRILAVNLKGAAFCSKGLIPVIEKAGGGSIVNVSSVMALKGRDDMPQYDACKAGLLALTRAMAVAHWPQGIRVNAVCPGSVITQYHIKRAAERGISESEFRRQAMSSGAGIMNRQGLPMEIAYAILFLASQEASFITAETLQVTGGSHAVGC